jgi:Tol biopolymer transport system component
MRICTALALLAALLIFAPLASRAQSGYDLFQKALTAERAEGKLNDAIALYQRVVREFPADRALVAKALVQMGQCYEKQGNAEARKVYERVLREFADQPEAAEARKRLAKLMQPAALKSFEPVVRQVWAGTDVDLSGAPSPDGRLLSFTDRETGDVAVRDLATGEKRRLTPKGSWIEFALSSVPAPDGKQVAYAWLNKDLGYDLRVVALDGSPPRVLYSNPEVASVQPAAWSPDGQNVLAVFTRKDNTNELVLVSVDKGSVRVLKALDWRFPAKVSLSPDGQFVVYDLPPKENLPQRDIFLLSVEGGREVPLVQHPANDLLPVWAPDGKSVVFASDRTGTMGLWIIRVANGKPQGAPELLKPDIGKISTTAFTKDGALYYGLNTGMRDVYSAKLDVEAGIILEPPTPVSQRFVGSNLAPDWSPDGKYLAYVSRRVPGSPGGSMSPIIVRSLATGEERELVPAMTARGRPRWSRDGRGFMVFGSEQGRKGIYLVDAQAGASRLLVPLEPASYSAMPAWSPDGKKIFYTYPKGQELLLRMRNLETGEETELYRGNAYNLAASPDGQSLAFTLPPGRLMILPLAGGSPRELLSMRAPEMIALDSVVWTPDGKYLLCAKGPSDQPWSLWRIPVQGGEPMRLNLTMEGLNVGLRLHADGQRIVFSAGQNKQEVWVMENFLPVPRAAK